MDKTALRNYCLHAMGITQWKMRDNLWVKQLCYLLCYQDLETELSLEKKQLLQRLTQALGWSQQQMVVHNCAENVRSSFEQKLQTLQPNKIIIFGEALAQNLGFNKHLSIIERTKPFPHRLAIVSALEELLHHKAQKKQTWQLLQSFINLHE